MEIQHSGRKFQPLGVRDGNYIWPSDEFLSRTKHKQSVVDKIVKLNKCGVLEGSWPRGWYPERRGRPNTIWYDCVGKREFIKRWGRDAFDMLPKSELIRRGKRVAVTSQVFANGK